MKKIIKNLKNKKVKFQQGLSQKEIEDIQGLF